MSIVNSHWLLLAVAIFKKYFSDGMYELHIESDMKKDLQDKLDTDASDPNIFQVCR